MKAPETTLRRRTFVTAAVCAPAIAVVALAGRQQAAPALAAPAAPVSRPPSQEPVARSGYHETEHIRQYYASAAF